jgi:hypothetical protein
MNTKVIVKTGFGVLSDSQAIATAGAVIKGLYAEKSLATPPVDQATVQTAVDDLNGSIAVLQAQGGGMAATVVKKKKREVLNGLLRKLGHYVQANCNDDVQIVLNSGFQAKATSVRSQSPPGKVQIISVDNGQTTQLVAKIKEGLTCEALRSTYGSRGNRQHCWSVPAERLLHFTLYDDYRSHDGDHLRRPGTCVWCLEQGRRLE